MAACCRLTNLIVQPGLITNRIVLQTLPIVQTSRKASSDVSDDNVDYEMAMLEKLRDISGLTDRQKRRMRGQMPDIDPNNAYQNSMHYHRRLYAKLGSESGIDPRLSWTGRKKAKELTQLFKEWEPPLSERMSKLEAVKKEATEKERLREEKVTQNMAKMNQWMEEYRQKQKKKEADELKREAKKKQVLEEAREYFGYYVDPRDSKFQEMLEEKEQQEKKLKKKQKKEKRLEILAARLKADALKEE